MSSNSRYKTHTGREFNMSAFAEKNGNVRAVGNSSMNARGDIVDAKGNVKIPSQNISRAVANLQNNQSKQVSLKADETINPVQNAPLTPDAGPAVVSSKDIVTADGQTATEIEYSDGSMAVIPKAPQTPTSL